MITGLMLRFAALFAPAELRVEWLAEWRGEAAFIRAAGGRTRTVRFCLGAFQDAAWLRRNVSPPQIFLQSPRRCLALLAALATICLAVEVRPSGPLRSLSGEPYRAPDRLAMVSPTPRTPSFAGTPVDAYRAGPAALPGVEETAFYAPQLTWADSKRFVAAPASANLFRLLGLRAPASGLVLRWSAWRRCFHEDPRIIGRTVQIGDSTAIVTGIIPEADWRLPGFDDGWLLDGSLAELPSGTKGYMVARLREPLATGRAPAAAGGLTFAPLPGESPLLALLLVTALALAIAPAAFPFGLGAYACNRRSWLARLRGWTFLLAKLLLLGPIVLCVFWGLGVWPVSPQAFIMGSILAMRWALADQRSRCPVCLHSLTHPIRIGEASHTFLSWYGTEFVCSRGHGFLQVAELTTSSWAEQRWLVA